MKEPKSDNKELSFIGKVATMSVVIVLMILAFFILSVIFKSDSQDSSGYKSCETRFDSTACPEPDYSPTDEELRNTPDATPYDHPDDCGGYSCKQLEEEFKQNEL